MPDIVDVILENLAYANANPDALDELKDRQAAEAAPAYSMAEFEPPPLQSDGSLQSVERKSMWFVSRADEVHRSNKSECGAGEPGDPGFQEGNTCASKPRPTSSFVDLVEAERALNYAVDYADHDRIAEAQAEVDRLKAQQSEDGYLDREWESVRDEIDELVKSGIEYIDIPEDDDGLAWAFVDAMVESGSHDDEFLNSIKNDVIEDIADRVRGELNYSPKIVQQVFNSVARNHGVVPESFNDAVYLGGAGIQVDSDAVAFDDGDNDSVRQERFRRAFQKAIDDKVASMADAEFNRLAKTGFYDSEIHDMYYEAFRHVDYGTKVDWYIQSGQATRPAPTTTEHWKPFGLQKRRGITSGDPYPDNYPNTQAIAKAIQYERTRHYFDEFGLDTDKIPEFTHTLWKGWLSSSSSRGGRLIKFASSAAFGALSRDKFDHRFTTEERLMAVAHLRATWEASQYVLEKAGVEDMTLWRGLVLPRADLPEAERYDPLPSIQLKRAAAQSFTAEPDIANSWSGVDVGPIAEPTRVVLRASVPRTAMLSIPAFGDNTIGEAEVIVLGIRDWNAWDAWFDKAPIGPIEDDNE